MNKYLILSVVILLAIIGGLYRQIKEVNKKWETAEGNVKAYANIVSNAKGEALALQLTVSQLDYFKDSVLQELNATRTQLKIKDRNLKALQSISSSFSKRDTIILKDTLFKDPHIDIDTLMGDKWYSVRLGFKYPSMIAIEPHLKSEKHIIVSHKKETVDPPKRFFLLRWFQKKHTVIHIDVVEKNPYIDNKDSRYVEVIK